MIKAEEIIKRYQQGERDFSGVNLRGQLFRGANLQGANFRKADLRGANFRGADLREADFSDADIRLTNFQEANLVRAKFYRAIAGLRTFRFVLLFLIFLNCLYIMAWHPFLIVIVAILYILFLIAQQKIKDNPTFNPIRSWVISLIGLGGTSFRKADLTEADFTLAQLKFADFREAILTRTCWHQAKDLNFARVGKSILANPKILNLLISGEGEGNNYTGTDLRGANLNKANLQYANFKEANLREATFQDANLEWANLTLANAVDTNFMNTRLTGACLEDWHINSSTNLDNVNCQFVFLLEKEEAQGSRKRYPSSGELAPGEFTKLFKEVFDTVDLIFYDGVNKPEKILAELNEKYELSLQTVEEYKYELAAKDKQIEYYQQEIENDRRKIADLTKWVEDLSKKPIVITINKTENN